MYYFVLSAAFCILTVTIKCEYGIPNTDRLMFPLLAFPISSFFFLLSKHFSKGSFYIPNKIRAKYIDLLEKRVWIFFLGDSIFSTTHPLKMLVNIPYKRHLVSSFWVLRLSFVLFWGFLVFVYSVGFGWLVGFLLFLFFFYQFPDNFPPLVLRMLCLLPLQWTILSMLIF